MHKQKRETLTSTQNLNRFLFVPNLSKQPQWQIPICIELRNTLHTRTTSICYRFGSTEHQSNVARQKYTLHLHLVPCCSFQADQIKGNIKHAHKAHKLADILLSELLVLKVKWIFY